MIRKRPEAPPKYVEYPRDPRFLPKPGIDRHASLWKGYELWQVVSIFTPMLALAGGGVWRFGIWHAAGPGIILLAALDTILAIKSFRRLEVGCGRTSNTWWLIGLLMPSLFLATGFFLPMPIVAGAMVVLKIVATSLVRSVVRARMRELGIELKSNFRDSALKEALAELGDHRPAPTFLGHRYAED